VPSQLQTRLFGCLAAMVRLGCGHLEIPDEDDDVLEG